MHHTTHAFASRRSLRTLALTVCVGTLFSAACQTTNHGTGRSDVLTAEQQKALTPAQVVADLKAGNERFVADHRTNYNYAAQVHQTASGQHPKAVVLSCLDSRIPPEIVFDQGIGDIFVARVAGNFENVDTLGSMEFGTALAGAKAIVVLGHTECGAVKGAADNAQLGNLTATLANITPAVEAAKAKMPGVSYNSKNHEFVQAVADANVRLTMQRIASRSPVLAERIAKGDLIIVGGMYDLHTGQIAWME
jgi:carbonic anhydrase